MLVSESYKKHHSLGQEAYRASPGLAFSCSCHTSFGEEPQVFKQRVRKAGTGVWELNGLNKIDARDGRYGMWLKSCNIKRARLYASARRAPSLTWLAQVCVLEIQERLLEIRDRSPLLSPVFLALTWSVLATLLSCQRVNFHSFPTSRVWRTGLPIPPSLFRKTEFVHDLHICSFAPYF